MAMSTRAKRKKAKAAKKDSQHIFRTFMEGHYGNAITLPETYVRAVSTGNGSHGSICTHTHASGWTISGVVKEDYYTWVNDFSAHHPEHGNVWGNFQDKVRADTMEGLEDFLAHHPPKYWDYGDI